MITLKKIDAYGQVFLLLAFVVNGCIAEGSTFLSGYFVLGSWQVLSTLVHLFFRNHTITISGRRQYLLFLVLVMAFLFFSSLLQLRELLLLLLMGSIVLTPLAAICYCIITFRELHIWQHRRFIQLR